MPPVIEKKESQEVRFNDFLVLAPTQSVHIRIFFGLLSKDECSIEPEHMRLIQKGRELKQDDTVDSDMADEPIQVLFTAGHTLPIHPPRN